MADNTEAARALYRERYPERVKESAKRFKERNPEKIKAYDRKRRAKPETKERVKRYALTSRGFTPELVQMALDVQNSLCLICEIDLRGLPPTRVHVDHCHKTMRPRGILCSTCNQGLGLFKDNPYLLEQAAKYLRAPTISPVLHYV